MDSENIKRADMPLSKSNKPEVIKKEELDIPVAVIATRAGFYKCERKVEGDKFTISSIKHLGSWMKKI